MDKKQREARRQQEDIALQRGLLWVVGAVALEVLLMLLNRFYINYPLTDSGVNTFLALHEVLKVLRIAAPVAAVLALLWTAWQVKQGKKYALPLIQGEIQMKKENSLPRFVKLKKVVAK